MNPFMKPRQGSNSRLPRLSGHAGAFDLTWIDIGKGERAGAARVQGGGTARIEAPGKGFWAAAIVRPPGAATEFTPPGGKGDAVLHLRIAR